MKLTNIIANILKENNSETLRFWHGGNLDDYSENIAQKKGRYKYGPGLYLISKYDLAKKYAKGGRKLYLIDVEVGNDIEDSFLDIDIANQFIRENLILRLRKEVTERLTKYVKNGKIRASIFENIILNSESITSTKTKNLRKFYIDNNIDYQIVDNAFGSGGRMMVLYNMGKIKNVKQVKYKDEIDVFDF